MLRKTQAFKADDLVRIYRQGRFPYPLDPDQPVMRQDNPPYTDRLLPERAVFLLEGYSPRGGIDRNLKTHLITVNHDFEACVNACADAWRDPTITHASKPWINDRLIAAYTELYGRGMAFSVEVWTQTGDRIVGGLFGAVIGRYVTVESMYRISGGTSQPGLAAIISLAKAAGAPMVDVQFPSAHMMRWGAEVIPDSEFQKILAKAIDAPALDLRSQEGPPHGFML